MTIMCAPNFFMSFLHYSPVYPSLSISNYLMWSRASPYLFVIPGLPLVSVTSFLRCPGLRAMICRLTQGHSSREGPLKSEKMPASTHSNLLKLLWANSANRSSSASLHNISNLEGLTQQPTIHAYSKTRASNNSIFPMWCADQISYVPGLCSPPWSNLLQYTFMFWRCLDSSNEPS